MPELVPSERGARPSRRRRGSLGFAVDGYLAARVSRQTRRIGGRMGNAYRYASVYFVPLGFAKGWLKGSGGRPAARLFSFGNYPRAGMFRAVQPLRERAISEISTPVARGCQPRRCEPAWLAPSRGGRSACHVSSQGQSPSTCRLAARWFWHGPGVPDKAVVSRSSSGGLRKRAGLVNGGTQPGLFPGNGRLCQLALPVKSSPLYGQQLVNCGCVIYGIRRPRARAAPVAHQAAMLTE